MRYNAKFNVLIKHRLYIIQKFTCMINPFSRIKILFMTPVPAEFRSSLTIVVTILEKVTVVKFLLQIWAYAGKHLLFLFIHPLAHNTHFVSKSLPKESKLTFTLIFKIDVKLWKSIRTHQLQLKQARRLFRNYSARIIFSLDNVCYRLLHAE